MTVLNYDCLADSKARSDNIDEAMKISKDVLRSLRETVDKCEKAQNAANEAMGLSADLDAKWDAFKKKFGEVMDAGIEAMRRQQGAGQKLRAPEVVDEAMVAQILHRSKKVVVLTGAGVSAESGIPTFRGSDGFWTVGSENYRPQELATWAKFNEMPHELWQWYQYRWGICRKADPNPGHYALAELESLIPDGFTLVTQNIDGLHQRAGTKPQNLHEVHGNIHHMRCDERIEGACLHNVDLNDEQNMERVQATVQMTPVPEENENEKLPVCPACGVRQRPKILWFDECYNECIFHNKTVMETVAKCDLLLVVGTQLTTNLPSQIVNKARLNNQTVVVRIDPLLDLEEVHSTGMLHLQAKSGEALPRIVAAFRNLLSEQIPAPLANPSPCVSNLALKAAAAFKKGAGAPKAKAGTASQRSSLSKTRRSGTSTSGVTTSPNAPDSAVDGFFVYGTLRPDDDSGASWTQDFQEGLVAEPAWLTGASLYVEQYPALCLEKTACKVRGVLLSASTPALFAKKLSEADKIECYPDLYDRTVVTVKTHSGADRRAIVYHRTNKVNREQCVCLADGDWLSRPRDSQ
jgi:NAD-dependent deacetylase